MFYMIKNVCFIFLAIILFGGMPANAISTHETYVSGRITNLTAIQSGLMIMVDAGLPSNCIGSPYGWILIPQEHEATTALLLSLWLSGRKDVTVYTSGLSDGTWCAANQIDPVE